MKRVIVQIRECDLEELDAMASAEGISRAAAVREAVERYLRDRRWAKATEDVIRSYAEDPPEDFGQSRAYLSKVWPTE